MWMEGCALGTERPPPVRAPLIRAQPAVDGAPGGRRRRWTGTLRTPPGAVGTGLRVRCLPACPRAPGVSRACRGVSPAVPPIPRPSPSGPDPGRGPPVGARAQGRRGGPPPRRGTGALGGCLRAAGANAAAQRRGSGGSGSSGAVRPRRRRTGVVTLGARRRRLLRVSGAGAGRRLRGPCGSRIGRARRPAPPRRTRQQALPEGSVTGCSRVRARAPPRAARPRRSRRGGRPVGEPSSVRPAFAVADSGRRLLRLGRRLLIALSARAPPRSRTPARPLELAVGLDDGREHLTQQRHLALRLGGARHGGDPLLDEGVERLPHQLGRALRRPGRGLLDDAGLLLPQREGRAGVAVGGGGQLQPHAASGREHLHRLGVLGGEGR